MPPKRKVVYLSRFFEENVELVANMCVKCYQQEDEVKVTAINRNFSNAIKSRRLESLQKKQKLNAEDTNSKEISSDFITQKLDENFITDFEEPSLDLHDISSSINTELDEDNSSNLTRTSNDSLNEIRSNLDENTDSQSIVENSLTNYSCNFTDNEGIFDQTCDTLPNYKDKITDCENTSKILEHISKDTDATFKNIFRKSSNVLEYALQNDEDNVDVDNIIPNNTYSSVKTNSEINWNNILNKIKSKQQYEEDTSSDSSEENFNFFQDRQAKIENISTEKISVIVSSQSIFKTLNSKNSRLYDDYSTNVNSSKNYKHKSISSVKYNVNKIQLEGCAATLNNKDLTSVNNDKRCVSSKQSNAEIVETTNDDSIMELINRIHSPEEFLTDNNKINVAKEEKIKVLKEEKIIEEIQEYKIVEVKQNLEEIKTIEKNLIEPSIKEKTCFSQYFSQKSNNISNVPQKHIECSESETQIVSQFFPSITNNFPPTEEEPKRKINFSKLRKKM